MTTTVGVLGATSLVGRPLLKRLVAAGTPVVACSRRPPANHTHGITWCQPHDPPPVSTPITHWIALCPAWVTVDTFAWLVACGAERVVAVSSTSVVSKKTSPDAAERRLAERLADAEMAIVSHAARDGVSLVLLRPTMIYDGHTDRNITAIADFARRWGWFPICGPALGLRQPVHADDVADACLAAVAHPTPKPMYTLSGGEALPFRDMVMQICREHGLTPRLVSLPPGLWKVAAMVDRWLGRASGATAGTAARMNDDIVFDHADAAADLGFRPRSFTPVGGRLDAPSQTVSHHE